MAIQRILSEPELRTELPKKGIEWPETDHILRILVSFPASPLKKGFSFLKWCINIGQEKQYISGHTCFQHPSRRVSSRQPRS